MVDIRSFNAEHNGEEERQQEARDGHDLLGRRGKILVLGPILLDIH